MSKLLCVLIDGLRIESLACAHVPCIDRFARAGTLFQGLTPPPPCRTLPFLMSLLNSLPPEEHGVLSDAGWEAAQSPAFSLLSLLRYRHQTSAAFYSSDRLRPLFPPGALQTGMVINSQSIRNVDQELAEAAARHLQREKPDCCLLYLEGANIAGNYFGFDSNPYIESVEQADRAIGLIQEHLMVVGLQQEYVLMVVGCCGSAWPVLDTSGRSCLPLILSGPGIRQGAVIDRPLSLYDLAPTMAAILDLAPHPDWRGRVAAEVFQPPSLSVKVLALERVPVAPSVGAHQAARAALTNS